MKNITKKGILGLSMAMGLLLPNVTTHASTNSYKTFNCVNPGSGTKYCTNTASLVGGGGNINFTQQSHLDLYNAYFLYMDMRYDLKVNSGNPYFMDSWVDPTTSTGMGTTKYYNGYKGEFLKNYGSIMFDGYNLKSTYQTSPDKGYGGQFTTLICSDLVAGASDNAVVFNMITYPKQ